MADCPDLADLDALLARDPDPERLVELVGHPSPAVVGAVLLHAARPA